MACHFDSISHGLGPWGWQMKCESKSEEIAEFGQLMEEVMADSRHDIGHRRC